MSANMLELLKGDVIQNENGFAVSNIRIWPEASLRGIAVSPIPVSSGSRKPTSDKPSPLTSPIIRKCSMMNVDGVPMATVVHGSEGVVGGRNLKGCENRWFADW